MYLKLIFLSIKFMGVNASAFFKKGRQMTNKQPKNTNHGIMSGPRDSRPEPMLIGKMEVPQVKPVDVNVPWYRQDGIKRTTGIIVSILSVALYFIAPELKAAAVTFGTAGAGLWTAGKIHGVVKNKKGTNRSDHAVWTNFINALVNLIIYLLNKKKEKN
jgi:hypothetical protein